MISYTDNQDGTSTLSVEFTRPTPNLIKFIEYCSEELYIPDGVIDAAGQTVYPEWSSLSNSEKLQVLNLAVGQFLMYNALERRKLILTNAAVDQATADPDTQL